MRAKGPDATRCLYGQLPHLYEHTRNAVPAIASFVYRLRNRGLRIEHDQPSTRVKCQAQTTVRTNNRGWPGVEGSKAKAHDASTIIGCTTPTVSNEKYAVLVTIAKNTEARSSALSALCIPSGRYSQNNFLPRFLLFFRSEHPHQPSHQWTMSGTSSSVGMPLSQLCTLSGHVGHMVVTLCAIPQRHRMQGILWCRSRNLYRVRHPISSPGSPTVTITQLNTNKKGTTVLWRGAERQHFKAPAYR